jgi:hypothetical protein
VELLVPIIVAVITGPVVVILHKLRRENSDQHAHNTILLKHIGQKVDRIGTKLDTHIGWHNGKKDSE